MGVSFVSDGLLAYVVFKWKNPLLSMENYKEYMGKANRGFKKCNADILDKVAVFAQISFDELIDKALGKNKRGSKKIK